jgi:tetratricopeptide (TPR) repeat protein
MMEDPSTQANENGQETADDTAEGEETPRAGGSISGQDTQLVILLLLAGLVIRLMYVTLVRHDPLFYSTFLDAADYRSWATAITEGAFWSGVHDVMPFYAYLNAGVRSLFGDTLVPLYVCQTIAGLVTAWMVLQLGRTLFRESIGLLAMSLFLLHPDWIVLETRPVPTVWIGLFVAAGVLFLVYATRSERPRWRWLVASSLAFALAVTTGARVLFVVPVVMVWIFFCYEWTWSECLSAITVWGLPMLMATGGILWLNHQALQASQDTGGALLQSDTGRTFYGGSGPGATGIPPARPGLRNDRMDRMVDHRNVRNPVERDRMFFTRTLQHLRHHPGDAFSTAVRKLYYFMTNYSLETTEPVADFKQKSVIFALPLMSFGFFMVLGGIGLIRSVWRGGIYTCVPVVLLGLLIGPFLAGVSVRGRTTAMPLLAVLTGQGLLYTAYAVQRLNLRVLSWVVPTMVVLMTGFVPMMNVDQDRRTAYLTPYWRAKALWQQGRTDEALEELKHSPSRASIPHDHLIYLDYLYARYLFERYKKGGTEGTQNRANPMFPATTLLQRVERRNITFPDAYTLMGRIKISTGQYAQAVDHLRTSNEQHIQQDTWILLGEALLRNDAYTDALDEMKQALNRFPGCDQCRMIKARALGLQEQWDRAIDVLKTVLEHPSENVTPITAEASFYTGYLYERTGRPDQAINYYKQAIDAGGEFGQRSRKRMKRLKERMNKNSTQNSSGGDSK